MRSSTLVECNTNQASLLCAALQFTVEAVRASHKYGFNVDPLEFKDMQNIDTVVQIDLGDGRQGMAAITKAKEIKHVVGKGGVFDDLIVACVRAGGTWLTCLDLGDIIEKYEALGFFKINVSPFDPSYPAPPEWAGMPDVVSLRIA